MKIFILGKRENYENYASAIETCGAKAVFSEIPFDATKCNALLLTGGGDVSPDIYSSKNTSSFDINAEKDITEINLVKHFCITNKAILGICKGIQIINVAFGGTLTQNIENLEIHSKNASDSDKIHSVKAVKSTTLYNIYGEKFSVNSAHHQAINKLSNEFEVIAYSEDGIIEGIEHRNKAILAVQFHPERMTGKFKRNDTVDGIELFNYFINYY